MGAKLIHGTEDAWRAGCRERCCQRPHDLRREKIGEMRRLRGIPAGVDPAPVQAHIAKLKDLHHTRQTIAEASGLTVAVVANTMTRPKWVNRSTADRILRLPLRPPWETPGVRRDTLRRVPAQGTVRRLRALSVSGWSPRLTAEETGLSVNNVRALLRSDPSGWVSGRSAEAVREAYRELLTRNPPTGREAERMIRIARYMRWRGPGHWEDIDHDVDRDIEDHDILVDYVRDHPGQTKRDLIAGVKRDLDMPVTVFDRLYKTAEDANKIHRIRTGQWSRVYTVEEENDHAC